MLPVPQAPEPVNGAFDSLYTALRAQARHYLCHEQNAHSLSPTVLVHEAWMALARSHSGAAPDRDHYFHLVSRVMKNLLVDHARRKRAAVRGGGAPHVELAAASFARQDEPEIVLAVACAMEGLAATCPALAMLVEMRYFGGFNEAEVAQILGVSVRSVRRKWAVARLRLLELLQPSGRGKHACA